MSARSTAVTFGQYVVNYSFEPPANPLLGKQFPKRRAESTGLLPVFPREPAIHVEGRRDLETETRQVFHRATVGAHSQGDTRGKKVDRLGGRLVPRAKVVPLMSIAARQRDSDSKYRSLLQSSICTETLDRKPNADGSGTRPGVSGLVSTSRSQGSGCVLAHATSGGRFERAPTQRTGPSSRYGTA